MINDGNHSYNSEKGIGDSSSQISPTSLSLATLSLIASTSVGMLHRHRCSSDKAKALRSALLGQRVGYIEIDPFAYRSVLAALPKRFFHPDEVIPCDDLLCVIERGEVRIVHGRHRYHVKTMRTGGVFGEMPVLGQTMLMTQAVAGPSGVLLTIVDANAARQWIVKNPGPMFDLIVPRLAEMATDRFRTQYQPGESRLAALLLKLAGGGSAIEGYIHDELAEALGLQREAISVAMMHLRKLKIISTGHRKINILDAEKLRELSQM